MNVKTYFPERLEFRVPRGAREAVAALAAQTNSSPAELMRRILLAALEAEGVKLPPLATNVPA